MKKHFWEKSCRYSIRKLTVGTASVLLGAVFLVNHTVAADSVEVKQTEPTSVEAITKPDSEPKAAEATETTNPSLAESPVVSESKPAVETQTTNSQASEEAIVEAKENKEPEKTDQPVTKQENYQLNYDQPTAPPMMDGKNKPSLSEMEKWEPRFSDSLGKRESSTTKRPSGQEDHNPIAPTIMEETTRIVTRS